MTSEERKTQNDEWWEERRKQKEEFKKMEAMYKKLSYRDRLLFLMVVQFLLDNPDDGEGRKQ